MNFNLSEFKTNKLLRQIFFIIISIIVLLVLIINILGNIVRKKDEIELTQQQMAALNSHLNSLVNIADNQSNLINKLAEYESLLPEGYNQDEILNIVQNLCEKYQVSFSQIIFDSPTLELDINCVNVSLNLSGNYYDVMSLLDDMTTKYRIITLNDTNLTGSRNGDITVNCTISVYYR